jgi:hypothetical protein
VTPAPVSRISRLDAITTHWSRVDDLSYFALRYEVAIRKYLSALLKHPETVQEVTHEVMVGILKRGLGEIRENAGRFRDYLRTSLRHAVFQYWRKQARQNVLIADAELDEFVDEQPGPEDAVDRVWVAEWRECLLERTWRAMVHEQQKGKINPAYHTILRLAVENPGMTSTALAAKAEVELNRPIRSDAYRQLLRRARRHFAELLHDEVARTLDDPTPEALVDEFIDLGILDYMRDYINPKLRHKLHRSED